MADNIFVLRPGFKKWHIRPHILREQLTPFIQEIGVPIRADAYIDSLTTFLAALERGQPESGQLLVAGKPLCSGLDRNIAIVQERLRQGTVHEVYHREDFTRLPVNTPWLYLYREKYSK